MRDKKEVKKNDLIEEDYMVDSEEEIKVKKKKRKWSSSYPAFSNTVKKEGTRFVR